MRIRRRTVLCGGQTATAMATCASLGLKTKYVGVTGSDDNGRRMRRALGDMWLDVTDVVVRDGANQFAVILIDETTGERIVLWDRDELLKFRDGELPADDIREARVVHVDDVDQDAAIRTAQMARRAGAMVTSDLEALTDRTEELLAAVATPIFAEELPLQLTGATDHETALRNLRQRHSGLLCVTLGRRGSLALDGDVLLHEPAFGVHAVDTTGAGDVFRGGFIYGLLQGWPAGRILRFANAAAAVSCTRIGAMTSVPTLDDVQQMMGMPQIPA
jgi:sugar/nucleoside kinase (ribokinase family)